MDIPKLGKLYDFSEFSNNWLMFFGNSFGIIPVPTKILVTQPQFATPTMSRMYKTEFWFIDNEVVFDVWVTRKIPHTSLPINQQLMMYEYWEEDPVSKEYLFLGFMFLTDFMYSLECADIVKNNPKKSFSEIHFLALKKAKESY